MTAHDKGDDGLLKPTGQLKDESPLFSRYRSLTGIKETIPQQCLSFLRASPYRRHDPAGLADTACAGLFLDRRGGHTYRSQ